MITKTFFGNLKDGTPVDLYTLDNGRGMTVKISTRGGALVSVAVPDRLGGKRDVVLGYDDLAGYEAHTKYLGALVGRFANRISGAMFTLDGKTFHVTQNDGKNSLHGGGTFDCAVWSAAVEDEVLALTYLSPDGEDGYPGKMTVTVRYWLDGENALHIGYSAKADQPTLCNLTNHAYFNLSGCERDVLGHALWLNADRYTDTDGELIPVSDVPVEGTPFDFRQPKPIAKAIYDNSFSLRGGVGPQATLYDQPSGVFMEMFTSSPCVQVYTSCMLESHFGRGRVHYGKGSAICLETQLSPNCPNRPGFTGFTVRPGETWTAHTAYKFSVR